MADEELVLVDPIAVVTPPPPPPAVVTAAEVVPAVVAAPLVEKAAVASVKTSSAYLAQYEEWVNAHTGIARNLETMLYIAPQLVPVRHGMCMRRS